MRRDEMLILDIVIYQVLRSNMTNKLLHDDEIEKIKLVKNTQKGRQFFIYIVDNH